MIFNIINALSYVILFVCIVYTIIRVNRRDKTFSKCLSCGGAHNPFGDIIDNIDSNIMICGVCKRDNKFKRLTLPFKLGHLLNLLDKLDNNLFLKSYMILLLFNNVLSIVTFFLPSNYKIVVSTLSSITVILSSILMMRYSKKHF